MSKTRDPRLWMSRVRKQQKFIRNTMDLIDRELNLIDGIRKYNKHLVDEVVSLRRATENYRIECAELRYNQHATVDVKTARALIDRLRKLPLESDVQVCIAALDGWIYEGQS